MCLLLFVICGGISVKEDVVNAGPMARGLLMKEAASTKTVQKSEEAASTKTVQKSMEAVVKSVSQAVTDKSHGQDKR